MSDEELVTEYLAGLVDAQQDKKLREEQRQAGLGDGTGGVWGSRSSGWLGLPAVR